MYNFNLNSIKNSSKFLFTNQIKGTFFNETFYCLFQSQKTEQSYRTGK